MPGGDAERPKVWRATGSRGFEFRVLGLQGHDSSMFRVIQHTMVYRRRVRSGLVTELDDAQALAQRWEDEAAER